MAVFVRAAVAGALALEAANTVLWASRIVSYAQVYDAVVLGMVLLRIGVTTVQVAAAWMLATRALPAVVFARAALGLSALLLVAELGLRLAPSSLPPGTRWITVGVYAIYALVAIAALGTVNRHEPGNVI